MPARYHCDRCGEELMFVETIRVRVEVPSGQTVFQLCERCSVSLKIWVENRPYSLLPDGSPAPIEV